jgi:N-acetylmuramic acid 6-phosphate etherase
MTDWIVAIEGGATHCTAGLYTADGELVETFQGGPCNPIAYGLEASAASLVVLARDMMEGRSGTACAYVGSAGVVNRAYCETLARALCEEAEMTEALVASDLHPMLYANAQGKAGILVIAGTGSNVLAQDDAGKLLQIGGRGTLLGDEGSGYAIGARALRAAAHAVDETGPATTLVRALMEATGVVDFEDLVPWGASAKKADVAKLSLVAWQCAEAGDAVAAECIEAEATELARHAVTAARRMNLPDGTPVFGQGGLFHHGGYYRDRFTRALVGGPNLTFSLPTCRGHEAVLALRHLDHLPDWAGHWTRGQTAGVETALPMTERSDTDAPTLDSLDGAGIVARMCAADATVPGAVARQAAALARAVDLAATALEAGGRIIYVGAGTSGRLGVLDASECPPTFGTDPSRVLGVIAGGERALRESVEGAEDNTAAGCSNLMELNVDSRDFVVGIAASGSTTYTLAALDHAQSVGAATALLCCNPAAKAEVDVLIAIDTGPEVLTGSTRLKAGTATKLALNIISTGAMALSGYVYAGLMVRMRPVNKKLIGRAQRIVAAICDTDMDRAANLLEAAEQDIAVAILMGHWGEDATTARRRLEASGGKLGVALKPRNP